MAFLRHMIGQRPPHIRAADIEDLLNLTDLADEVAADLLRLQCHDKAVMLVARAHERSDIGVRGRMCTVGQWQRHSNLPPQASRSTGEECGPTSEHRQLFFHRLADLRDLHSPLPTMTTKTCAMPHR